MAANCFNVVWPVRLDCRGRDKAFQQMTELTRDSLFIGAAQEDDGKTETADCLGGHRRKLLDWPAFRFPSCAGMNRQQRPPASGESLICPDTIVG